MCIGLSDFFWSAGSDDRSAASAGFRAEVDEVIGGFDHIQIMLNDEEAMTAVDKALEDNEELLNVSEV